MSGNLIRSMCVWGLGLAALLCADVCAAAAEKESDQGPPLSERERVAHVLNRMAFGPSPGQVDHLLEIGVKKWMREQLSPSTIDDAGVDQYINENCPSLRMTSGEIFRAYRPPYENDPPTMEETQQRSRMRNQVREELRESVCYRAVYSQRQFQEVIVAFWREHFSIDQNKDDVGYLANSWETEVIRRFAFGKFENLLLASARHPAMLIYLDNIISQKPLTESEQNLVDRYGTRDNVPSSVRALQRYRGLNENYARELMELHTLGVDRGYTQQDVTELARVLTGWTARWSDGSSYGMEPDRKGNLPDYAFYFNKEYHDRGEKTLLGTSLRGGDEEQGVEVIRSLACHRLTAEFVSRKLCAYLLRDQPSEALVAQVAEVFLKSGGDLPKVYEAIVFSDDFFYRQNHRVKFKTPFEFVVSSLRATGAEIEDFRGIDRELRQMGQATYQCPDPTGWYDKAEAWLDPGVLVYRWTFALDLAGNKLDGVRVPESVLANLPGSTLRHKLTRAVLPAGLSERTRAIIDDTLGQSPESQELLGVLLGSPDFQQQ